MNKQTLPPPTHIIVLQTIRSGVMNGTIVPKTIRFGNSTDEGFTRVRTRVRYIMTLPFPLPANPPEILTNA